MQNQARGINASPILGAAHDGKLYWPLASEAVLETAANQPVINLKAAQDKINPAIRDMICRKAQDMCELHEIQDVKLVEASLMYVALNTILAIS